MLLPQIPNTDPDPSNPQIDQPIEFPRQPHQPGEADPKAVPNPAQPSTRPPTEVNPTPGCTGVGTDNSVAELN